MRDHRHEYRSALLPACLRQQEQDFAIFHALDEKMQGQDTDEVQARIDKAVEEVKAAWRGAGLWYTLEELQAQ